MDIPFHRPLYDESDEAAVLAALRSEKIVGDGDFTQRASKRLAEMLGARHVLLTTSCTHAMELAMMVLRIQRGDEVIVPSFTFVSTTNCVLRQGARLVFSDIRPDTLTLDADDLERKVSSRTRAVISIVYGGVTPDMDRLLQIVRAHSITLVEDAAQGLGVTYKRRPAGTMGDIGCLSFHESKNLSTGEGGALVTNNTALAERAEIIREKGTNRKQFLKGLVNQYTWVDIGSSFLPSDLISALLYSQLAKAERVTQQRETIHRHYTEAFMPLARAGKLTLPTIPAEVSSNYHIFYVLMNDETIRNRAIEFFRTRRIGVTFHFLPLHLSPLGRTMGCTEGDCPVTESVCGRLLRLPIYPSLTQQQQDRVISTMMEFVNA